MTAPNEQQLTFDQPGDPGARNPHQPKPQPRTSDNDLHTQGVTTRQLHTMTTIHPTEDYL